MPYTYEQAYPILKNIALGFVRKNGWYQVDELVNEVWLQGRIQKVKDEKLLIHIAYCDMKDYMRTQDGRKNQIGGERKRRLRRARSLDSVCPELDAGETYGALIGKEDSNLDLSDAKEQLKVLMAPLTRAEKLIVAMLAYGFSMKEIGLVIGIHPSRISQLNPQIMRILKARAKELDIKYGRIKCETSPKE